jgi:hypothetical protein
MFGIKIHRMVKAAGKKHQKKTDNVDTVTKCKQLSAFLIAIYGTGRERE